MGFLCRWGIHRWVKKLATHNRGRLVKRCRRCGKIAVKHLKQKPTRS